jgi:Mg/Co/Ni transporter MgtE
LVEVVGSVKEVPTQSGPIGVKVGVTWGVIVTFKVCGFAQGNKIESGLNVYVPEALGLMVAGVHVPLIPLGEVVGKGGGVLP